MESRSTYIYDIKERFEVLPFGTLVSGDNSGNEEYEEKT
jgi:hypothetical protein